jgi:hypothetical protein
LPHSDDRAFHTADLISRDQRNRHFEVTKTKANSLNGSVRLRSFSGENSVPAVASDSRALRKDRDRGGALLAIDGKIRGVLKNSLNPNAQRRCARRGSVGRHFPTILPIQFWTAYDLSACEMIQHGKSQGKNGLCHRNP